METSRQCSDRQLEPNLFSNKINDFLIIKIKFRALSRRAGRTTLRFQGVRELAKKAGVTANTVTRTENGADAVIGLALKSHRGITGAGRHALRGTPARISRKRNANSSGGVFLSGGRRAGWIHAATGSIFANFLPSARVAICRS